MPTKTRDSQRVSITGVGWKKPLSISTQKYAQVSKAILTALSAEPITFTELVRRVGERLPGFEGSVSWYTVSVARELEVQGKLVRQAKPVLYAKAPRDTAHRIFKTPFAAVYPLYVQKAERKGRTQDEVDEVICWLTGYDRAGLRQQIEDRTDFESFFGAAPAMNPNSHLVTGVVCGVRVENVEDPLMKKIRLLDKLVDELARGKALAKVLRR